ncbi:4'-phosphopantetheinyl transferase family protein [Actinoplanes derwentensis]|uniref:4'-phosphopantetheinyl transferase EntD (Siderophore biosynthesis) n=1 Tax=Actinoplanes derwentensis TaxID=113562 RepID=A0A1H2DE27_9ACTN|nr:4'-phosphopantetheinyl transferase superfamily protein [Actinoplanes derwentensis]GID84849.1 4'-phosphopantetheinyl transferase [Actinoplanes derwentensis]SDT80951.1 4'-phosphopantetheinyl transferase EntD (siderophore biosynthesis) [Actinoplanes derwentensis]
MIERLLPSAVVAVEAFGDVPGEPVFPGEEQFVARAVDSRRREFVTARRCARAALAEIGHAPVAIPRARRGAPGWPAGVVGSITHCPGYRAAAVARSGDPAAIGIDAEPNDPLPDDAGELVIIDEERDMLDRLRTTDPAVHWDRLLFSAKESVFKAWYPLTRRELDFTEARVDLDPVHERFTAGIRIDGTRLDGGAPLTRLNGRFLVSRGLVVTAVVVPGHPVSCTA